MPVIISILLGLSTLLTQVDTSDQSNSAETHQSEDDGNQNDNGGGGR